MELRDNGDLLLSAKGLPKRSERGQSMVEFALTAPVLLILLLGLIEFGHGMNSYLTVVAAARDAARFGAQVGPEEARLKALVDGEMERLPNAPVPSNYFSIVQSSGSAQDEKKLKVTVCYDHDPFVGVPGLLSGPIQMCSSTTIREIR